MEATAQVQQANVQQTAGYYRTKTGASGMTAVQGVDTAQNPFGAMLEQLLGGDMEMLETPEELLKALEEKMQETDTDAAMQLLAQLFATQPGLVQQVDAQLLAQLTGQTAQSVATLQQSAIAALLGQQTPQQDAATATPAEILPQDSKAFLSELARQTGMEVVQTVAPPQGGEQNASLLGEAGYQRTLYEVQQQIDGTGKGNGNGLDQLSAQTEETAQPKNAKQAQPETAMPLPANTRMFANDLQATQLVQQAGKEDVQSSLAQVKTGLMEGVRKGNENFIIKLKPEGLGEITVRMVQQNGKISMDIFAANQHTQRMLSSEIVGLRQAMEPYNVVVNAQQSDGGSTSFSLEQQMRQGFAQQQQHQQQSNSFFAAQDDAREETPSSAAWSMDVASGLDAYI